FGVVEGLSPRIGLARLLSENPEVQLVRPPVVIRSHSNIRGPVYHRALRFRCHDLLLLSLILIRQKSSHEILVNCDPVLAFSFAQLLAAALGDAPFIGSSHAFES